MTVREVCEVLERLAPPSLAYSWDRAGLAIGEPSQEVKGVLAALSVTRETFAAAKRAKANQIVSHHPLIWEPMRALRTDDPHTALCLELAHAGVSCYSAHTNLDVVPGGVNAVLAERLGLTALKSLLDVPHAMQVKLVTFVPESHLPAVRDAVCDAGAGIIGDYTHCTFSAAGTGTFLPGEKASPFSGKKHQVNEEPERRFEVLVPSGRLSDALRALLQAHPYEEPAYDVVPLQGVDPAVSLGLRGELPKPITLGAFAAQVRMNLDVSHVRVVGDLKHKVRHVAVLGGAGGSEAAHIPGGVDVLVTGDVDYHDALAAQERGLAIVDAGHVGTEKWIVPALVRRLRGVFPKLRMVSHTERDPFRIVVK
ncbi:MAG: Nif3-like dinuclear metal center hexameric protein [Candidatus Hydrogenedentes bacterium]|nr:Nif3-like dinuclear metal center hexameric protein [Candidatus Hydrogenedentota bacterium]